MRKLISVPFLSLTFFPSSRYNYYVQCMYACVCCSCLQMLFDGILSCRLGPGAQCALHSQMEVLCVCLCVPQEFLHYTCWLFYYIGFIFVSTAFPERYASLFAPTEHSQAHSFHFDGTQIVYCFYLICQFCHIHFDFSYFAAIQHINKAKECFQDRILGIQIVCTQKKKDDRKMGREWGGRAMSD